MPELEEEPREAVAYGSPAALYPGVEGVSQRVGSVRHERFSNRDRTRGSDLRRRRGESMGPMGVEEVGQVGEEGHGAMRSGPRRGRMHV